MRSTPPRQRPARPDRTSKLETYRPLVLTPRTWAELPDHQPVGGWMCDRDR